MISGDGGGKAVDESLALAPENKLNRAGGPCDHSPGRNPATSRW